MNGCIIADIKKKTIESVLSGLNLGNNSIVAVITEDGKEISISRDNKDNITEQGKQLSLSSLGFIKNTFLKEDAPTSQYVKYNNKEYLYINNRIGESKIIIASLIPKTTIMAQANSIKNNTII
jgi:methyl-accepting chemotaxis protein